MCGIVGIIAKAEVNHEIYEALTVLQHRGQDAAGILTSDGQHVAMCKDNGLVREAIRPKDMLELRGYIGLGHVRYPTSGTISSEESQPFFVNSPFGLSLVHNGNLINVNELRHQLQAEDFRYLNTQSDSEILLNILAHELQKHNANSSKLEPETIFSAVESLHQRVRGSYSAIALLHGHGLLAFRDKFGIRPLVIGMRKSRSGSEYIFASESVALDALGYKLIGDVAPGEAVFIDNKRVLHRRVCAEQCTYAPCLFEYIYLARPDSIMDGISIHKARLNMGERLGEILKADARSEQIDVVIPIPDTARTAALPLAQVLGCRYTEGFVKNRYIARTFIMHGQKQRQRSLSLKLNTIKEEFAGKNVLLVDDSIVRGTTSRQIIAMARAAGAKKVFFASASPAIRFPNVYGIDMPNQNDLIAAGRDDSQVADMIDADWLVYLPLDAVVKSVLGASVARKHHPEQFEDSVFTGSYITADVSDIYLRSLQERI